MLSTGKLNRNRDRRIYISRIIESKDDGGRLQEMQASFYVRKCRTQCLFQIVKHLLKYGRSVIITLRQKIICSVSDPSVHIMHYAMCYVEICDHKNHA